MAYSSLSTMLACSYTIPPNEEPLSAGIAKCELICLQSLIGEVDMDEDLPWDEYPLVARKSSFCLVGESFEGFHA